MLPVPAGRHPARRRRHGHRQRRRRRPVERRTDHHHPGRQADLQGPTRARVRSATLPAAKHHYGYTLDTTHSTSNDGTVHAHARSHGVSTRPRPRRPPRSPILYGRRASCRGRPRFGGTRHRTRSPSSSGTNRRRRPGRAHGDRVDLLRQRHDLDPGHGHRWRRPPGPRHLDRPGGAVARLSRGADRRGRHRGQHPRRDRAPRGPGERAHGIAGTGAIAPPHTGRRSASRGANAGRSRPLLRAEDPGTLAAEQDHPARRVRPGRSALRVQAACHRGSGRHGRHRGRARRPDRRGRSGRLPQDLRPAGLHDRQRLLQEAQRARQNLTAAAVGRRTTTGPTRSRWTWTWSSAVCPACHIVLVESTSSDTATSATAETAATSSGAVAVSNSWGGDEGTDDTAWNRAFQQAGVAVTASSGDAGFTRGELAGRAADRDRGRRDQPDQARAPRAAGPSRRGRVRGPAVRRTRPNPRGSTTRTARCAPIADISAVADPATGLAVYVQGDWGVSAAPAPPRRSSRRWSRWPAIRRSWPARSTSTRTRAVNDVTSGANPNWDCGGDYLCTAGPGLRRPDRPRHPERSRRPVRKTLYGKTRVTPKPASPASGNYRTTWTTSPGVRLL